MQKQVDDTTAIPRSTNRVKAIGLMILAVMIFSCLDATAKYLVAVVQVPLTQAVWIRFLGQFLVIVVVLGAVSVPRLLHSERPGLQVTRSFLLLASTALNFVALRHLRLDQTVTIQFLAPLLVAVLAGPILGEWIGWRRLLAVIIGFLGIVVMIRPGFAHIHPAVLFALGSMLSYAAFMLITRYLTAYDPPENTLFYSLFAGAFLVAPLALLDWAWPRDLSTWLLFAGMGFFGGAGHYIFILAHRAAPASIVAPFIYVQLVSVTALGFFIFGDIPDLWTLAGALIVVASGVYLVHRERIRRAESRATAG